MIVKNESQVIKRCLDSVKDLIDYWVIVDTGSTDGTQEMIQEIMKDIPGELYERTWVSFEHNRNEALELAYPCARNLLFIDADEVLHISKRFSLSDLKCDIYLINVLLVNRTVFHRQCIVSTRVHWFWKGIVHEQVYTDAQDITVGVLPDSHIESLGDGSRTHTDFRVKFLEDAKILEEALKVEPNNSRYVFYLANSYFNANEFYQALINYQKRSEMGDWDQEVFYSLYTIGRIQFLLKFPPTVFINSFYRAFYYRPTRSEPLYWIAQHYMDAKNFNAAFHVLMDASAIPLSDDAMMVEPLYYHFIIPWMLADCAYALKNLTFSQNEYQKLLAKPDLPVDMRKIISNNYSMVSNEINSKSMYTQRT
jgi:glycosyltransferase involved in cell wall biosynthesis